MKPDQAESSPPQDRERRIQELVRELITLLGEDPQRHSLERTPARVQRALQFLTKGYQEDPRGVINGALFVEEYQEMIVCRDIDFFSLCEHHMLPFSGKAHIAYIPEHHIIGLSKLARLVEVYARRLQVQERMTTQIATTLMEELQPQGVGVVLKAEHLCMRMRGVEKQNSTVVTSAMLGVFRERQVTRQELMAFLHNSRD